MVKKIYQWRKHFFSCSARNRETSMSACVTGCQGFTKIICWLFAGGAQLCWEVGILLLLLQIRSLSKCEAINKTKRSKCQSIHSSIPDSVVARSSERILHLSQHLPEVHKFGAIRHWPLQKFGN